MYAATNLIPSGVLSKKLSTIFDFLFPCDLCADLANFSPTLLAILNGNSAVPPINPLTPLTAPVIILPNPDNPKSLSLFFTLLVKVSNTKPNLFLIESDISINALRNGVNAYFNESPIVVLT